MIMSLLKLYLTAHGTEKLHQHIISLFVMNASRNSRFIFQLKICSGVVLIQHSLNHFEKLC